MLRTWLLVKCTWAMLFFALTIPCQDFLLGTPQRVFHDIDELVEVAGQPERCMLLGFRVYGAKSTYIGNEFANRSYCDFSSGFFGFIYVVLWRSTSPIPVDE